MKQLRKQANEFEEKNAILQKHVENMRSAITKLEMETLQQQVYTHQQHTLSNGDVSHFYKSSFLRISNTQFIFLDTDESLNRSFSDIGSKTLSIKN